MIKTFMSFLNKKKEPHLLVCLFIWIFIGLESHLWWQTSFHGASVLTALVGYSLLFYVLPRLTGKA
ncbi:hypothetical protein [Adhaeribacter aerolatus]|uniref:hypothetical protein n=1 Tax=Adhaeribacter aerolatus TaxID=670289 RepID=UPI0011BD5BE8|nr:hypothetical protein [Adhaeribacter aerolatus]